jgi:hypothetical protein
MTQATLIANPTGGNVQLYGYFSPARRVQVVTAGAASTAATALPTGAALISRMVEIRSDGGTCYVLFGDDSIVATADEDSQLFPAGEKVQQIPDGATHFAVIRAGEDNVTVQIELLK